MKVLVSFSLIAGLFFFFTPLLFSQEFHLVRDLNDSKSSSPASNTITNQYGQADPFTVLNGIAYFVADDGIHGRELWKSDGTTSGTSIVADVFSGEKEGNPQQLTIFKNRLFFSAVNEAGGGIWTSDGTAAGTVQLFAGINRPSYLTVAGNYLYFLADGKLYKSDGTASGTTMFLDFQQVNFLGNLVWMYPANSKLFLVVFGYDNNTQLYAPRLWVSDGTAAGTQLLNGDVLEPTQPVAGLNSRFYFTAHDKSSTQWQLYETSGVPGDVVPVKSTIAVAAYSSVIRQEKQLYVFGHQPGMGIDLCSYNMEIDTGITIVKHLISDSTWGSAQIAFAGNRLFFTTNHFVMGAYEKSQLWTSDGTAGGTIRLKETTQQITALSVVGGTVYFDGSDSLHGRELWRSDGTMAGTIMVSDVAQGKASSNSGKSSGFSMLGNRVLFNAYGTDGFELFGTDGTSQGTQMVKDINKSSTASSGISAITPYSNKLLFTGYANDAADTRFWKSDGSADGTLSVGSFVPAQGYPAAAALPVLEDTLYCFGTDSISGKTGLYKVEMNSSKVQLIKDFTGIPEKMKWQVAAGRIIYFLTYADGAPGTWKLWRSDGTSTGTLLLVSGASNSGANYYADASPVVVGNTLYFTTYDGVPANYLWRTDGTIAGTFKIVDSTGQPVNNPRYMTKFKNKLCFYFYDANSVKKLWYVSGESTKAKKMPGTFTGVDYLAVAGDRLFFMAYTDGEGRELWSVDTAMQNAAMAKDISPGVMSSDPHALVAVGKNMFFFAWDQVHGTELWKSDGTADGTIQVKDITPGSGSTVMYAYDNHISAKAVQLAGKLYMELNQQLWVSDGTDTGTHQLSNPAISDITAFDNLTVVQNTLWFNGTNYHYGKELYAGAVTPATLPLYVFNGSGDFSDPANWLDNQVPPQNILKGMEVRITPQRNGEFILNQPIHFNGGKLTIAAGAKIALNNLIIK